MELVTIFAFEKSTPGPEKELVDQNQLRTSGPWAMYTLQINSVVKGALSDF